MPMAGRQRTLRAHRLLPLAAVVSLTTYVQSQAPVFHAGTDLIAVDVQVVDKRGAPVRGLQTGDFRVSVGGHRRPVASVQLIDYGEPPPTTTAAPAPTEPTTNPTPAKVRPRVFAIAVDTGSFDAASSRGVAEAAAQFVRRLQPTDLVGLYAYPAGPAIAPTTNHATVIAALDRVTGSRLPPPSSRFQLTPTEIVDGGGAAVFRICGGRPDPTCALEVQQALRMQVLYLETAATDSLGALREILRGLAATEGRKTLVLVSGGMTVSDTPGHRPDVGDLGGLAGEEAARVNVAVYTLFVDWKYLESFSAANRQASSTLVRDSVISSRWLDRFSGTAGGKLFTVSTGSGDNAFDHILAETASYYLLGISPEPGDRDGKPKRLDVRVNRSGVTVRARSWVVVPRGE